jgi:tetratricopeptide (TPR) repeat protein
MGDWQKALDYSSKAYETLLRLMGPDHHITVRAQMVLGSSYVHTGKPEEGIRILEEAVERSASVFGPDHNQTQTMRFSLVKAYSETGNKEKALKTGEELLESVRRAPSPQAGEIEAFVRDLQEN